MNIVSVRKMGLTVYGLVILSSLALLVVTVDGQNDFDEETSDPNGDKLPWFTSNGDKLPWFTSNGDKLPWFTSNGDKLPWFTYEITK